MNGENDPTQEISPMTANLNQDEPKKNRKNTLIIVITVSISLFIIFSIVTSYLFIKGKELTENFPQQNSNEAGNPESLLANQLKLGMMEAALPKEKVVEVHLGGYGVPAGTLEMMQQAIVQKIGVKTIIDSNYPDTIPQDESVYDKERQQFNGGALWDLFGNKLPDIETNRYLVVINEDIFTAIQPERPYVVSRSLPSNNVAIISVKRLQRYSDSDDKPASPEKYRERVEKLSLRILGVTVGLSLSPDADNKNCLMYQSDNIDELDKVGTDFCETTKEAIEKAFETHYMGKPVEFTPDMWNPQFYKSDDFQDVGFSYGPNTEDDSTIKANLISNIASAQNPINADKSLEGFSDSVEIACSGNPIINLSPDKKQMAFFRRSCLNSEIYYCLDTGSSQPYDDDIRQVDKKYIESGAYRCMP